MKKITLVLAVIFTVSVAKSGSFSQNIFNSSSASTAVISAWTGDSADAISAKEKSKKNKKKSKACSAKCQTKCAESADSGKSCCQTGTQTKAAVVAPAGMDNKPMIEEPLEPATPK